MRHDWLDRMLSQRLHNLQTNYSLADSSGDPMIMFAYMVAQCTIVYLCQIRLSAASSRAPGAQNSHQEQLQERMLWAAQEIGRLAKDQVYLYFHAHTFVPLAIFLGATKLKSYLQEREASPPGVGIEVVEKSLQATLEALRKLGRMNELAVHYLKILESDNVTELDWA